MRNVENEKCAKCVNQRPLEVTTILHDEVHA